MKKFRIRLAYFILLIVIPILGGYTGDNMLMWLIICLSLLALSVALLSGTGAIVGKRCK